MELLIGGSLFMEISFSPPLSTALRGQLLSTSKGGHAAFLWSWCSVSSAAFWLDFSHLRVCNILLLSTALTFPYGIKLPMQLSVRAYVEISWSCWSKITGWYGFGHRLLIFQIEHLYALTIELWAFYCRRHFSWLYSFSILFQLLDSHCFSSIGGFMHLPHRVNKSVTSWLGSSTGLAWLLHFSTVLADIIPQHFVVALLYYTGKVDDCLRTIPSKLS